MRNDFSQERYITVISTLLFGVSSLWIVRIICKERERSRKCEQAFRPHYVECDDDKNSDTTVSHRCRRAILPATSYLKAFLIGLQYACDSKDRVDGFVILCMAENKLVIDLMSERLLNPATTSTAFSDPIVYCYNSFLGLPVARQAISYFLAKRFLHTRSINPTTDSEQIQGTQQSLHDKQVVRAGLSLEQALISINPAHIGIGSGAAGVLNGLFYLLGDDGDACLIPAPYYAAFENDMSVVAGIVPFAVHMANPTHGPSPQELDLAYIGAKSQGLNPRFLLITNPHNPLGVIYSKTVMLNAVSWARKRYLHTIVDEIYALSTHQKYGHGFESILKILNNQLGTDVHFVWSMSKDFGLSGLRVGIVYSQNETFLNGLANLNIFGSVSNPIQMIVSELLTDNTFIDLYLDKSRARLCRSYRICTQKLEEMVLPFVPASAGQFVYADFSSLLPQKTMEWEQRLSQLLIDHARLIMTPGESQRERMPGMFRVCYAWVSPEVLEIGMERLSRIVAKIRRMDWSDLNQSTLSGVII